MKNLKNIAYISVIVLAILILGSLIWFSASYFFSLNSQVSQNTQNIQSIIQYINQRTVSPTTSSTK
jgi:cell division protein YceG involved in septum cleavage